jgi:hypothetical protein
MLVDHLFSNLFPSCGRDIYLFISIFRMPSSLRFWVDDSQITTPRETHHPDESWPHSGSEILLRRAFRDVHINKGDFKTIDQVPIKMN